MSIFDVHPDICQANTLSSEFYTDEKYFHESKERIFAKTWHFVGTTEESSNLKPFNISDEPFVFAKDGENFACFANVCTHRGAILIEKECEANGIRCRYHGRRFNLNGKFLSMPEFENVQNFPSENDDLKQIPHDFWKQFIFAAINPISPLNDFTIEMSKSVKSLENYKLTATKDYEVNAHWALYCENYLEGFHVPFVHPALNNEIDYGTYTTELFRYSNLQTAYDNDGNLAALHYFIFPNMMFNFYPWGLSLNIVKPITPIKTTISYYTYVSDETKVGTGAGGDLETVELEDQAIVESVQRGLRSRFYNSGRYSPTREQGTHHFHRLIAEFMS
jgi:choline monooxygenase